MCAILATPRQAIFRICCYSMRHVWTHRLGRVRTPIESEAKTRRFKMTAAPHEWLVLHWRELHSLRKACWHVRICHVIFLWNSAFGGEFQGISSNPVLLAHMCVFHAYVFSSLKPLIYIVPSGSLVPERVVHAETVWQTRKAMLLNFILQTSLVIVRLSFIDSFFLK